MTIKQETVGNEKSDRAHALALDLGSTRFKLGTIDAAGRLIDIQVAKAPELSGEGLIREGDPDAYLRAIDSLLGPSAEPTPVSDVLPFGLVCQRSSFVIWDRDSGRPLTPVISWQDRRAEDWCAAHADIEPVLIRHTGLLLSPHYAGPKLAMLLADDPQLAAQLHSGHALFGNLDAWLTWRWSDGVLHQTDLTMAARTAMFDIEQNDWSDDLLTIFGVPREALPVVTDHLQAGSVQVAGVELCGSIADQAAGMAAVVQPFGSSQSECLVNIGTGAFVMQPIDGPGIRRSGYLTGPVLASSEYGTRFAIEGTINGVGPAIESFGSGPTHLHEEDQFPGAFAIPDLSGVGAPHWRADIGLTLSSRAQELDGPGQRLICIEGLLFRIYEILLGLNEAELPDRILVSGGLASEPAIVKGLAALLERPIRRLDEPEATLLGAARLVGGLPPYADPGFETIMPGTAGRYLLEKFARWRTWCAEIFRA
jgi:glycerol kinase